MKGLSPSQQCLLSEVCTLTKLIMVMPAYLRSTMTQKRLNHLMILYVRKKLTDSLDLVQVVNEFASGSEHRMTVFGTFDTSDI